MQNAGAEGVQLLRSYTTSNLLIDARPLDADEFHCATCADSFSLTMDNQTISVAIPKNAIPNYQYDNLYSEFILWPLDIYQQAINSQYKGDLFLSNVFDLSIKYKSSGEEYPINSEAGGDIIIGIPNLLALDAMKKYDIAPQDVQCLTRFTEQYYSVLKGTYEVTKHPLRPDAPAPGRKRGGGGRPSEQACGSARKLSDETGWCVKS